MYAFSFKLKTGRMQLFSNPKLIALKKLWEARGCHIVAFETTKDDFTQEDIVALIVTVIVAVILQKLKKKLEI